MPRRQVAALALSLTALFALVLAGPADAAKRKVPFGFFGTVFTNNGVVVSDAALDQTATLMARSGVESVRTTFSWQQTEPAPGVYNWATNDAIVRAAADHGLQIMGNVIWTPQWASTKPSEPIYYYRFAPTNPALYAGFATALVKRYGPKGTFWAANPSVPKVPIRRWQLWNEPMILPFWSTKPWPSTFTRLLRAAYPAIKKADRGSTVILASVVSAGTKITQWGALRSLYKAGAKKYFDQASINLFTIDPKSVKATVQRVLDVLRLVRKQMSAAGDAKKKINITELTWPAAVGKLPQSRLLGLETTPKGQAQRLTAAYATLAKQAKAYRLAEVDWYAWVTPYDTNSLASDVSFRFAGLTRGVSGFAAPMPILKTYAKAAAAQEGCRKGSNARRCGG